MHVVLTRKYDRFTIIEFINHDHGKYKESVVEWFEGFHSQKKFNNPADLGLLFVKAQLNKRTMKEGAKTLDRAIRAASHRTKRSFQKDRKTVV